MTFSSAITVFLLTNSQFVPKKSVTNRSIPDVNRSKPTFLSIATRFHEFTPISLVNRPMRKKLNDSSTLMLNSGASALLSLWMRRSLMMFFKAIVLLFLMPFRSCKRRMLKDERFDRKLYLASLNYGDPSVAERRAMAVKRVMEDHDCNSVRDFSFFVSVRGDTIFTQSWTPPVSSKIRGIVVLLHGLNEHSSRYNDFARKLNANGFKVYAMDWIGHGGSDGLHGYVHSLDYAVTDMKSFLEKICAENPALPCFCFGHSTGGAIVLKAVLDPKFEALVAGIVLTSPAIGVQPSHPIFTVLAPIFSFLLPRYQIGVATKSTMPVSRDPDALVEKYSDPLVYTGSIRVRTGNEILRITSFLQQNLHNLQVPVLVLHGTADTVTDPEASRKLYEEASSNDKTIKLLDGFVHDLLFEPERDEIVNLIIDWLKSRV